MDDTITARPIYQGPLGRIFSAPPEGIYDAWDWRGEYLGGFTTVNRAMQALREAQDVHQSLVNAYNNRSR